MVCRRASRQTVVDCSAVFSAVHIHAILTLAAPYASLSAWPGSAASARPSCSSAAATAIASGTALPVTYTTPRSIACCTFDARLTVRAARLALLEDMWLVFNPPSFQGHMLVLCCTHLAARSFCWHAQQMQR
jgi:hypothetical protein